jgi:ABC-type multidrug transport system ATPase subunit
VTLIHEPSLVLLDEPTLGLDAAGVDQLERLIVDASDRGVSFLVSSHDLHFIGRLCGRIVCLHAGEIIFDGSRDEFATQDHLYRAKIKSRTADNPAISLAWPWLSVERDEFEVRLTDNVELSRFLREIQPHVESLERLEIRGIDLREKYLHMLAEHSRVDKG